MKKVIVLGCILLGSISLYAEGNPIKVTKDNRGLFGYKLITETVAEGMHTLTCTDPGYSRCKPHSQLNIDETVTLSENEFEEIDQFITDKVTDENNTKGKINYKNRVFIVYSYNVEKDNLTYTIYSLKQAKELNLF